MRLAPLRESFLFRSLSSSSVYSAFYFAIFDDSLSLLSLCTGWGAEQCSATPSFYVQRSVMQHTFVVVGQDKSTDPFLVDIGLHLLMYRELF